MGRNREGVSSHDVSSRDVRVVPGLIRSPKSIHDRDCQRPLYKHLFLELFSFGYEDFRGKTIVGLQHEQKYQRAEIQSFFSSKIQ